MLSSCLVSERSPKQTNAACPNRPKAFLITNDKGNRHAHTNGELEFIAGDLICVAFGMVV